MRKRRHKNIPREWGGCQSSLSFPIKTEEKLITVVINHLASYNQGLSQRQPGKLFLTAIQSTIILPSKTLPLKCQRHVCKCMALGKLQSGQRLVIADVCETHTCFLMTSVACMMQRGGRPWFRASRMACSSVTLRVQLLERKHAVSAMMLNHLLYHQSKYSIHWGNLGLGLCDA